MRVLAHSVQRAEVGLAIQGKSRGFVATGMMIVKKESPLALYKGERVSRGLVVSVSL